MKVLAIGAHPDDIEYGCGGTLLQLKKREDTEISLFVASSGECAAGGDIRKEEQEKAAAMLGAKRLIWGGFPDTEIYLNREVIGTLEKTIKDTRPDIIFVNHPEDAHQDHRNLAESTIIAARYDQRVLYYEDFTARNFQPQFFQDISGVLEEKTRLLQVHASQVERDYPTGLDILESVKAVANYRGFQAKVKYAEGFCALRYLLDF